MIFWHQEAKIFCSMFLSFLQKWPFNLCLKLLSEFANFRSISKLFQTIGVRYDKFFWPEYMFFKGCFSFETEDLVFAWFWPDCLYISWEYRGQVSRKHVFWSKKFVLSDTNSLEQFADGPEVSEFT